MSESIAIYEELKTIRKILEFFLEDYIKQKQEGGDDNEEKSKRTPKESQREKD